MLLHGLQAKRGPGHACSRKTPLVLVTCALAPRLPALVFLARTRQRSHGAWPPRPPPASGLSSSCGSYWSPWVSGWVR